MSHKGVDGRGRYGNEVGNSLRRQETGRWGYLSKLRRDSIGTDFQSVRKLTNYVCAKPLESRLSAFRKSS